MAFASAASRRPALADINVTPLVDVMLVLLVIFMVTTPLLDQRLPLALPQGSDRPVEPPPVLELVVEAGDLYRLDGLTLAPSALRDELARRQAESPGLVLRVLVSPEADYQAATTALAVADRAGISNVRLD